MSRKNGASTGTPEAGSPTTDAASVPTTDAVSAPTKPAVSSPTLDSASPPTTDAVSAPTKLRKILIADPVLKCACGAATPARPVALEVVPFGVESHGRDSSGKLWRVTQVDVPAGWTVGEGLVASCLECSSAAPVLGASAPRPVEPPPAPPLEGPRAGQLILSGGFAPQAHRVDRVTVAAKPSTVTRMAVPTTPVPRDVPRENPDLSPTTPRPRDSRPVEPHRPALPSSASRAREVATAVAGEPVRANRLGSYTAPVAAVSAVQAPAGVAVQSSSLTSVTRAGTQAVSAQPSASASTVSAKVSTSNIPDAVRPVATGSRPNAPLEIIRAEAQPTRLVDVEPKVSAANVAEPPKPRPLVESWHTGPTK